MREMRTVIKRTQKPFAMSLLLIFGYSLMLALVPTSVAPVDAAPNQQAEATEPGEPDQLVVRSNSVALTQDNQNAPLH